MTESLDLSNQNALKIFLEEYSNEFAAWGGAVGRVLFILLFILFFTDL